jgi:flagellar biosynthesis/type III secretory pathway chaperone
MNTDPQRLAAVLDEEIRCAEAMLEALAGENRALADGDQAALALATDAKTKVVDALEKLEAERRELARGDEPADAPEWQRLRELIGRCKEQNQRNGMLLQARAENVRVALKALRGSDVGLYGATGRTPSRVDARTLGTA